MGVETPAQTEEIDWEARYRALLLETARAEDQWREIEEILKRGVSRLTLLIQDGNAVLDSMLERLRTSVREGGDLQDLGEHLKRISELCGLPNRRNSGAVDETTKEAQRLAADRLLLAMVDNLQSIDLLPATASAKIKQQLYGAGGKSSEDQIIADLVREIRDVVDARSDVQKDNRPARGNATPVAMELIEAMPIPAELEDEKTRIAEKLQRGPDADNNAETLVDLLSLCARARRMLQDQAAEIQKFLLGVSDRLRDIELCLNNYAKQNTEAVTNTKAMGESVRSGLREIQRSLESETEIAVLKRSVQTRLEAIEIKVSEGIEMQEKNSDKTEKEIKRLLSRLEQLESETQKLRVQVSQERALAPLDPLTKLHNRAALDEKIDEEINRSRRYKSPLALILWDLDHFKNINDAYGRQAGDKVLQVVAKILRDRQRVTDFSARYEGEKIVGLLPETSLDGAVCLAEDVRGRIEKCDFRYRGAKVRITVSAGVTGFGAEDTAKDLLSRAGDALNQAKKHGRNRIQTFGE